VTLPAALLLAGLLVLGKKPMGKSSPKQTF